MQQQQQQAMAAAAAAQTLQPNPDLALDAAPTQANKKQRELYIGNLASGVVTTEMLRELFNAVLVNMVSRNCPQGGKFSTYHIQYTLSYTVSKLLN